MFFDHHFRKVSKIAYCGGRRGGVKGGREGIWWKRGRNSLLIWNLFNHNLRRHQNCVREGVGNFLFNQLKVLSILWVFLKDFLSFFISHIVVFVSVQLLIFLKSPLIRKCLSIFLMLALQRSTSFWPLSVVYISVSSYTQCKNKYICILLSTPVYIFLLEPTSFSGTQNWHPPTFCIGHTIFILVLNKGTSSFTSNTVTDRQKNSLTPCVYVDFFFLLNLLPPYSLRSQGDNLIWIFS